MIAGLIVALFVMLLAMLTGLVGAVHHLKESKRTQSKLLSSGLFCSLQFAVIWLAYEWLRSTLFTGFPVLDAGYAMVGTSFDGIAPILGIKGISFVLAFLGASIGAGFLPLGVAVVLVIASYLLHDIEYTERVEARNVGVVQVNIPLTEKFEMARKGETFRIYSRLTEALPPQDLVLWSEAAFATRRESMETSLTKLRQRAGHDFIASGYIEFVNEGGPFNSLLVSGDKSANYRKQRLVPFGEYVPLENFLRDWLSWVNVPHSNLAEADTHLRNLNVPDFNLAPAICYEASFENDVHEAIRQGRADALLVVSEDAWFGDSLAPHQNFEMARMRAKEHGRYVIRAANSGISGIVGPDGEVVTKATQFTRTTLNAQVFTMRGFTPYTRFGPELLVSLLLLGGLGVVSGRIWGKRQADKNALY